MTWMKFSNQCVEWETRDQMNKTFGNKDTKTELIIPMLHDIFQRQPLPDGRRVTFTAYKRCSVCIEKWCDVIMFLFQWNDTTRYPILFMVEFKTPWELVMETRARAGENVVCQFSLTTFFPPSLVHQAIIYEGQDKNPEMCRVLLTHEIMCRWETHTLAIHHTPSFTITQSSSWIFPTKLCPLTVRALLWLHFCLGKAVDLWI